MFLWLKDPQRRTIRVGNRIKIHSEKTKTHVGHKIARAFENLQNISDHQLRLTMPKRAVPKCKSKQQVPSCSYGVMQLCTLTGLALAGWSCHDFNSRSNYCWILMDHKCHDFSFSFRSLQLKMDQSPTTIHNVVTTCNSSDEKSRKRLRREQLLFQASMKPWRIMISPVLRRCSTPGWWPLPLPASALVTRDDWFRRMVTISMVTSLWPNNLANYDSHKMTYGPSNNLCHHLIIHAL